MLAFFGGVCAIDLGFLQSLSRFVARHSSNHNQARGQFWASCVLFVVGLFILQMGLVVALSFILGSLGELHTFSLIEVVGLGTLLVTGNILTAGSAVYSGWQQYGLAGVAKILRSIFYLAFIGFLWALGGISVRSVLWSYALAALLPNLLLVILLLVKSGSKIKPDWRDFPDAHRQELSSIASYSLHGWLFTASTILISSGTIFLTGLMLPAEKVAQLQIALTLYVGVAAFVTGGMVPLTTIRAHFADTSIDSVKKVAETARKLVEESIVLVAILLSFFVYYLPVVVGLLLGEQARDQRLLSDTVGLVSVVLLPGLAVLPWFTFRFALVDRDENARYSRHQFISTCFVLAISAAVGFLTASSLATAFGVAATLLYRSYSAYRLGRFALPGIRSIGIAVPFAATFLICTVIHWFIAQVKPGWRVGELGDSHLQLLLYLPACASLYIFRGHLRLLLGLRLLNFSHGSNS
jgi:O-antigen/teichoic acid export membrane protein